MEVDDFWSALVAAVLMGLVVTVLGWLSTSGTSEGFVGRLVSRSRRKPVSVADPEVPGMVFVQLDGVPTNTQCVFRITRTVQSAVALIGLTVLSINVTPISCNLHMEAFEP